MGKKAADPKNRKGAMDRTPFEEEVYAITARIPRGMVSTYSDVAFVMGDRHLARAVGNALGRNPYREVPCYRVVRSDGGLGGYSAPGGSGSKARKLRKDGIRMDGMRLAELDKHRVDIPVLRARGAPKRHRGKQWKKEGGK